MKIVTNAIFYCCTVPVPILASVHLLVDKDVTFAEVSDSSFLIFQMGCFVFKGIILFYKNEKIKQSMFFTDNLHFVHAKNEHLKCINECGRICKILTCIFLGFCLSSFIAFVSTPIFSKNPFPMRIWLPFEPTRHVEVHIGIYVMIALGVANGGIANGVLDPLVAGLAYYAASQLKILKNNLKNLEKNAQIINQKYKTGNVNFKNQIIYEQIIECVEHQNAIFRFVQSYEENFSLIVFIQFIASIVVICLSCLQLSLVEPFTFAFFFMACFLNTMLIEVFLYCYFGSTLYEESNNITTSIYMGKWYEFDHNSQSALLVIMERSKKPMIVTAGKILDLSLATFTAILRRAYSLFAVLQNYKIDF